MPFAPGATVTLVGVTARVKFGLAAAVTTSVTVVVCVMDPLVPLIVSVELPVAVVEATVTVIVEVPEPVTEVGENAAVAPVGNPLAVKATEPVNPFTAVTVAV